VTLKKDKLVKGSSTSVFHQRIDEELDGLLDENVKLREEEQLLTEKFKVLKKRQMTVRDGSANTKKLRSTMDGSTSRSRSP
jgi:hypothetical protein